MTPTRLLFTALFIAGIALSCNNDNEPGIAPEPQTLNVADADALSEAINISGAERLSGALPAPTANGPTIGAYPEDMPAIEGRTLDLNFEYAQATATVEGVYLRVKGASDYWKIPLDRINNGGRIGKQSSKPNRLELAHSRTTMQEEIGISIGLPGNLSSGTFCFEYSIYDSGNGISEIVESCMEIIQEGPIDFNFLTTNNPWLASEVSDFLNDDFDDVTIGEIHDDSYYASCPSTGDSALINAQFRVDLFRLTFNSNNSFRHEVLAWDKSLNYNLFNQTCRVEYIEDKYFWAISGNWSYDPEEMTITAHILEDDSYEWDWKFTVLSLTADLMEVIDADGYKWTMVPE